MMWGANYTYQPPAPEVKKEDPPDPEKQQLDLVTKAIAREFFDAGIEDGIEIQISANEMGKCRDAAKRVLKALKKWRKENGG